MESVSISVSYINMVYSGLLFSKDWSLTCSSVLIAGFGCFAVKVVESHQKKSGPVVCSKMVPFKLQPAAVLLLFLNCWCTDTSEGFWVSSSRNSCLCTVFIFHAVTFISVEMKQSVSASQLLRCRQSMLIFAQLLWHLEWEYCSLGLTPDRSLNSFFLLSWLLNKVVWAIQRLSAVTG